MHINTHFLKGRKVVDIRGAGFEFIRFLSAATDARNLPEIRLTLPSFLPFFPQAFTCSGRNEHFFDQYQLT